RDPLGQPSLVDGGAEVAERHFGPSVPSPPQCCHEQRGYVLPTDRKAHAASSQRGGSRGDELRHVRVDRDELAVDLQSNESPPPDVALARERARPRRQSEGGSDQSEPEQNGPFHRIAGGTPGRPSPLPGTRPS